MEGDDKIGDCVVKAKTGELTLSDKIDRIVTNRILALPIFALIMWAVYYIAMVTRAYFIGVAAIILLSTIVL